MADAKVLVEIKNDVKYKKVDGSLKLLRNKIVWIEKNESVPKVEIFYSDIKGKDLMFSYAPLFCLQIYLYFAV